MDRISIPFSELQPLELGHGYSFDGLTLSSDNLKDICKFTSVPATLIGIDEKFGVHTLPQVLSTLDTKSIDALVVDDKVQILDPKSSFVSDDEFQSLISMFGQDADIHTRGLATTATITPESFSSDFLGDLYNKSIKFERLPEGGLALQIGLLRLACSNGARVCDAQFNHKIRSGVIDTALAETFRAEASNFDVNEYFQKIFMKNGQYLPISVADYRGMKTHLTKMTDPDTADLFFPMDRIAECYASQDIDIDKISKPLLNKLPAGLSYYQAFNTLTNAAKRVENLTLQDKIDISAWAKPSRLKSLKDTDLAYSRIPEFSAQEIAIMMGDH